MGTVVVGVLLAADPRPVDYVKVAWYWHNEPGGDLLVWDLGFVVCCETRGISAHAATLHDLFMATLAK